MLKKKEILKFINQISKGKNMKYPLSPNSFSNDDIYQAAKVLFSKLDSSKTFSSEITISPNITFFFFIMTISHYY